MGTSGELDGQVLALCVHSGQLFAATPNGVSRWNGSAWASIGASAGSVYSTSRVYALASYKGSLYAGGDFVGIDGLSSPYIARWDGEGWRTLGSGLRGGFPLSSVRSLAVHTGSLIVGGRFTVAGGRIAYNIAEWDGASWHSMDLGLGSMVLSLAADPNLGLFAGGPKTTALGDDVGGLARWSGVAWEPAAPGRTGSPTALAVIDGVLHVGGDATGVDSAASVMTWDGTSWSWLATNMSGPVYAMTSYGGELIASGSFATAGDVSVSNVASLRSGQWRSLGEGLGNVVEALAVFNGRLLAGGYLQQAAGIPVKFLAEWDGSHWRSLDSGMNAIVSAIATLPDRIVTAGVFTTAGGSAVNYVASWDGSVWSPLGTGMNGVVQNLVVHQGGVVAAGDFTQAGGISAVGIARWNGTGWAPLGSGMQYVNALAAQGNELYAGGTFQVRAWNGTTWTTLSSTGGVTAMTIHNGELIVGGSFTSIAGVTAKNVARWNGTHWSALGTGVQGSVYALASFQGALLAGSGPGGSPSSILSRWDGTAWTPFIQATAGRVEAILARDDTLYVGGDFFEVNGVRSRYIARWSKLPTLPVSPPGGTGSDRLIMACHPNPLRGRLEVQYRLPERGIVELTIHDLQGRRIRSVLRGVRAQGVHREEWQDSTLPPGVYFLSLRLGHRVESTRIIALR